MGPYEGLNLSAYDPSKDSFNFYHSRLRITIERCFGIFIQRFGIFWKPLRFSLKIIMKIIEAACRLHNFCLRRRIPLIRRSFLVDENECLINRDWRVIHRNINFHETGQHGNTLKQFIVDKIIEGNLLYDRNYI